MYSVTNVTIGSTSTETHNWEMDFDWVNWRRFPRRGEI